VKLNGVITLLDLVEREKRIWTKSTNQKILCNYYVNAVR